MIYFPIDIINILFGSENIINKLNVDKSDYFYVVQELIPKIYNKYFKEKTFKDFYHITYEGKDNIKYNELDNNILDKTTSKFNNEFNHIKEEFKQHIDKYNDTYNDIYINVEKNAKFYKPKPTSNNNLDYYSAHNPLANNNSYYNSGPEPLSDYESNNND